MELVYLWVEDYKNIHKQGFNFSPRFRCEYDGKTLTIDENDNYIPDFFGENINVTAIVGKNGSGKSSVFELLSQMLFVKNDSKYFYVLYDGNKQYCYSNNIVVKTSIILEEYKPLDITPFSSSHNTNIDMGKYLQMWYLNISHLERDGIIKNDAIETHAEINYLGIYEKNDFTNIINDSILQSFSNFNLRNFNFLLTEKIIILLKNKLYKAYIFEHLKIMEPFYLKILYDETKLNEKFEALKNDENLDIGNEIDELKKLLKINSENVLKIDEKDYSDFFRLVNNIYSFTEIPFKLILLDKKKNPIIFSGGEKTVIFYIERIAYLLQQIEQKNL